MAASALLPGEYQQPLDEAQLRKQLALAMMKQTDMPKGDMVGKFYVPPSIFQQMVPVANSILGQRDLRAAMKDEADIRRKYETDALADKVRVLGMAAPQPEKTSTDYSMEGMTGGLDQEGYRRETTVTPAQPPNYMKAEAAARASRFPGTQALADALMKQRNESMTIGSKHADPESIMQAILAGNDPTKLSTWKSPGETFGTDPSGNAYAKIPKKEGGFEFKYAPKAPTITNTIGDKKDLAGFNMKAKIMDEERPAAQAAAQQLNTTQQALATLPRGKAGIEAPALQVAQQVMKAFGINSDSTTATAELGSLLKQRIMSKLGGKLGAQISDSDVRFVSTFGGDLSTDKDALYKLLAIDAYTSMQQVEKYNNYVAGVQEADPQQDWSRYRQEFKFRTESPELSGMMDKLLAGKSIVDMPSPPDVNAGGVATPRPAPGQSRPKVTIRPWKDIK